MRTQIVNALRKLFLFHPVQGAVKRKIRVEIPKARKDGTLGRPSVWHRCEGCQELFKGPEIQVDHVEPVVRVEAGFEDWHTYITRMFCYLPDGVTLDLSKYRGVCKPCHQEKTERERDQRTFWRRKRKEEAS